MAGKRPAIGHQDVTSEPAIIADQLSVAKSGTPILRELQFTVRAGTLTGLIGPSGSGKTTLMRAIVGAQAIHGGTLQVLGDPAGAAALRQRIGYVTQAPAVYSDLTVRQNLEYFGTIAGSSAAHLREVLQQVDLEPQANQLVASLSGGQQARVSLAVALLGQADLLVLDEPTVGLDPVLRKHLWQLFAQLAQQGHTLLISSHVMDEAEQCPELLLLREGRVLSHGSKHALLASTGAPSVEAAFIQLVEDDHAL